MPTDQDASIDCNELTATDCSTIRSLIFRNIRSNWKWCCCNISWRARGRSALCRCSSAHSAIAWQANEARKRATTSSTWSSRCRSWKRRSTSRSVTSSAATSATFGPKFDDPEPVAEPFLSESLAQDHAILKAGRGGKHQRLLRGHRGGARPPAHLRPAADLDDARGRSAEKGQIAALWALRASAGVRER